MSKFSKFPKSDYNILSLNLLTFEILQKFTGPDYNILSPHCSEFSQFCISRRYLDKLSADSQSAISIMECSAEYRGFW